MQGFFVKHLALCLLCVAAFSVTSSVAEDFAHCVSDEVVRATKNDATAPGELLGAPERIQINGTSFLVDRRLGDPGKTSSAVYLTADQHTVIKIYPTYLKFMASREYWATLFLKERGAPVAGISIAPQTIPREALPPTIRDSLPSAPAHMDDGQVAVIVKPYTKGLSPDQLSAKEFQSAVSDLLDLKAKFATYFRDNRFVDWLKEKGVNPDKLVGNKASGDLLHYPDLRSSNFILTQDRGWVLIDP
jgi:hypothetical protein